MKKLAVLLFVLLMIPGWARAEESRAATIYVNGIESSELAGAEVTPCIAGNRLYLPLNTLAALGEITADWDEGAHTLRLTKGGETVKMVVDEDRYAKGEERFFMDAAPFADAGVIWVPLRFAAEAFDLPVHWDEAHRIALIGDYYDAGVFPEAPRLTTKEGYSFAEPQMYKHNFVVEDTGGEVVVFDKANYDVTKRMGRIGELCKLEDPRAVKGPVVVLGTVPGGYLVFTYAEGVRVEDPADIHLVNSYETSKDAFMEILKTVKTVKRTS
ncbi:Copper amine oxidase N-terminal domain [Aedoeadaptatus ivorii]|uniref:Copper amine oxidase N-terminal domain n=1 Tax=Aedoeadaptatus ivorii TaxID=54006 RepID=A0A448V3D1_9FIRM|nr:copper amine oxidase N-terminal domain-containing protein [Peptoniphilus ivorii]VEJ36272.1 Copper amine oxidase N-terminal domain [Peptoniphilus ivorii]